ncbi:MAG: sugar phosphate nucleotidyltransferase [Clostridia bacterium]|nr:sugar phosphate nucleotidyltransferase [Clostridia bacterium]
MEKVALILAGGKGNRFWPKSSSEVPKQFLKVVGENTLLQNTVKRIQTLIRSENIYVITGIEYKGLVLEQVPEVLPENIIIEPLGRDTAPALGYAIAWLEERYKDAILFTVPADHFVEGKEEWRKAVDKACQVAESEVTVLIGIKPTRPETAYGYIVTELKKKSNVLKVNEFVEKPSLNTATAMLEQGNCYWNSGMFIWKLSVVKEIFKKHLPSMKKEIELLVKEMKEKNIAPYQKDIPENIKEAFSRIKAISIDYGLIERCKKVFVIPSSFVWDDVGGWQALERFIKCDEKGNVNIGQALLVDTENCVVDWKEGSALIAGLRDMVIAGRDGKILVASKNNLSNIKKHLVQLNIDDKKKYQSEEKQSIKVVPKPWGQEIWWALADNYAAKILDIKASQATRLHLHQKKHETFFIDKGKGKLIINGLSENLYPGKVIAVEPGTVHRLMAETDLRVFEVSTSEMEDVIRLEDEYNRANT